MRGVVWGIVLLTLVAAVAAVKAPVRIDSTVCPNGCSHQGICSNGKCQCFTGHTGKDCSGVVECPHECWGNGECRAGICFCKPGFEGEDCSTRVTFTRGVGPDAKNLTQQLAEEAVARLYGKYEYKDNPSKEEIRQWTRPFMLGRFTDLGIVEQAVREGRAPPPLTCPMNCSNNGNCIDGECQCYSGYEGEDCSVRACPNKCSHNGQCVQGTCVCDKGWDGYDCSLSRCKNACSGNGECQNDGRCICYSIWKGSDCSTKGCPADCNHRGQCDEETGVCACQPGWGGKACEKPVNDGSSPQRAASSCAEIAEALGEEADATGTRWVRPARLARAAAFQVWCQEAYTVCAVLSDNKAKNGFTFLSKSWKTERVRGWQFLEAYGRSERIRGYGNFCPDMGTLNTIYAEVRDPQQKQLLKTEPVGTNGVNPFATNGFTRFETKAGGSVVAMVNRQTPGQHSTQYFHNANCARIQNGYPQGTDLCISDGTTHQIMMGYINNGMYGEVSKNDWFCDLSTACGHNTANAIIFYVK